MSPEVYSGVVIEDGAVNEEASKASRLIKFTTKADIWALGVILYQVLLCREMIEKS